LPALHFGLSAHVVRGERLAEQMERARGTTSGQGTAVSLSTALAQTVTLLQQAGIEDGRSEALLLLAKATGRTRVDLVVGKQASLAAQQAAGLEKLARRRALREPMAYVLGEREFWSLPFLVGPAVLIPRPDSETVVEAALSLIGDRRAPLRLLDLGTGSGCLLLALLSELPGATGLGIDASEAALALARANATRLRLAPRAAFGCGHWGQALAGPFDLIVSNPPYVSEADWAVLQPEVREFEPRAALLAGPDGLAAYRELAPDLARLLAPGASACLEIGAGQADAVATILQSCGLRVAGRWRDLAGIERCLVGRPLVR
jgi:release factor glutamine methyltransferase